LLPSQYLQVFILAALAARRMVTCKVMVYAFPVTKKMELIHLTSDDISGSLVVIPAY